MDGILVVTENFSYLGIRLMKMCKTSLLKMNTRIFMIFTYENLSFYFSCRHYKIPLTEWLKWKDIYFLTVSETRVQDQVARGGLWWSLSFWFIDGHLLALSSHGLSSVFAQRRRDKHLWCLSLLLRTPASWDYSLILTVSFNLNYYCKVPFQIQSHWWVGLQHMNFEEL